MKIQLWNIEYKNKFDRTRELVVVATNPIHAVSKALKSKPKYDDFEEYGIRLNKIIKVEFIASED